jgi:hypothetical protein
MPKLSPELQASRTAASSVEPISSSVAPPSSSVAPASSSVAPAASSVVATNYENLAAQNGWGKTMEIHPWMMSKVFFLLIVFAALVLLGA